MQEQAAVKLFDVPRKHVLYAFFLFLSILIVYYTVVMTGGTEFAFTHLMYVPIVVAAFLFGMPGAVSTALLGGFSLRMIPLNVIVGTRQTPNTWIMRTVMFVLVGAVVAFLFRRIRRFQQKEVERSLQNVITGLPNANKLKQDLDAIIRTRRPFSVVLFQILNLDEINDYIGYEIGKQSLLKAIGLLSAQVGDETVYSLFSDKFVVILPWHSLGDARSVGLNFLAQTREPVVIDGFSIDLSIRGGIVHCPLQAKESGELLQKVGIALHQQLTEDALSIYSASFEQKKGERYETMLLLFDAVADGAFRMVYQPVVDLKHPGSAALEALIRWDPDIGRKIGPEEFIGIAEEIGLINEITRWGVRTVIAQIKRFQSRGLPVKIALNISARDLRDHSIIEYMQACIAEAGIDLALFGVELTERGIIQNQKTAGFLLSTLREAGIQISLDDFGTGYNSLMSLMHFPLDYLKIDKSYVSDLSARVNRILVQAIIDFAHNTGRQVIAEGVEDEAQVDVLRSFDCDFIQGYYFSRPLPPEEAERFLLKLREDARNETVVS